MNTKHQNINNGNYFNFYRHLRKSIDFLWAWTKGICVRKCGCHVQNNEDTPQIINHICIYSHIHVYLPLYRTLNHYQNVMFWIYVVLNYHKSLEDTLKTHISPYFYLKSEFLFTVPTQTKTQGPSFKSIGITSTQPRPQSLCTNWISLANLMHTSDPSLRIFSFRHMVINPVNNFNVLPLPPCDFNFPHSPMELKLAVRLWPMA